MLGLGGIKPKPLLLRRRNVPFSLENNFTVWRRGPSSSAYSTDNGLTWNKPGDTVHQRHDRLSADVNHGRFWHRAMCTHRGHGNEKGRWEGFLTITNNTLFRFNRTAVSPLGPIPTPGPQLSRGRASRCGVT